MSGLARYTVWLCDAFALLWSHISSFCNMLAVKNEEEDSFTEGRMMPVQYRHRYWEGGGRLQLEAIGAEGEISSGAPVLRFWPNGKRESFIFGSGGGGRPKGGRIGTPSGGNRTETF